MIETLLLIGAVIALAVSIKYGGYAGRALRDTYDEWPILLMMACVIGGGVSGVAVCIQANAAALVWFAPRLYILEWVMGLIK